MIVRPRVHKLINLINHLSFMKKFTLSLAFAALMTAVALIFSGCSDDPEVGPEAPVISAKDMQVPATAGKQKLAYSIAHPVEGQSISAESDQTWIHDFRIHGRKYRLPGRCQRGRGSYGGSYFEVRGCCGSESRDQADGFRCFDRNFS